MGIYCGDCGMSLGESVTVGERGKGFPCDQGWQTPLFSTKWIASHSLMIPDFAMSKKMSASLSKKFLLILHEFHNMHIMR